MRAIPGLAAFLAFAGGPAWVRQSSPVPESLRGLGAVNARVAWASGARGTVLRTSDGGSNWQLRPVPAAGELDFRDLHAFDSNNAVVLSSGPGPLSRVYRTADGGARWTLALRNREESGFFDAIAFWDSSRGLLLGDSVDGRFVLLRTEDGGSKWRRVSPDGMPLARAGEGAFAASGACLAVAQAGRA